MKKVEKAYLLLKRDQARLNSSSWKRALEEVKKLEAEGKTPLYTEEFARSCEIQWDSIHNHMVDVCEELGLK